MTLGLFLGVVVGAALLEVLRARPRVPREVRVTVAKDAIPSRRSATLSDDAFVPTDAEPARGGPADFEPAPGSPADGRTTVRSDGGAWAVGEPVPALGPTPGRTMEPVFRLTDPRGASAPAAVGITIDRGADPMMAALQASALSAAMRAGERSGTMSDMYDPDPVPMLVPAIVASGPPSRGPRDDGGLFVGGSISGGAGPREFPPAARGERAVPRGRRGAASSRARAAARSMPAPPNVVSPQSGAASRSVPGSGRPRRASCCGLRSAPTTIT